MKVKNTIYQNMWDPALAVLIDLQHTLEKRKGLKSVIQAFIARTQKKNSKINPKQAEGRKK